MKVVRMTLCLLLAAAGSLFAQDIKVTVVDRDLDIPLEGVQIIISGVPGKTETGPDGSAVVSIPSGTTRPVMVAVIPGYETQKVTLQPGQESVVVRMVLAGVIEGKELVVERTSPGKNDEQSGISVSMDAEQMESTAQIGLIEDVMASVRTLPGVTFSGGWNAEPSVRGGYPSEMATVLDGVYILNPYHWGGSYSIFNPMMVSTVKLSNGIFSAKYGRATSGLLEVTTVTPEAPVIRIDSGVSTSSTDLFMQIPLGKVSGLLIGGKVTYLEPVIWFSGLIDPTATEGISVPPYIRDLYAKWYVRPASGMEVYVNAFLGTDGVGADMTTENDGISTKGVFDWQYINSFVAGGFRFMPGDKFRIHVLGGYNINYTKASWFMDTWGEREYSPEFTVLYGLSGTYSIPHVTDEGFNTTTVHQGQLKVEMDALLTQEHVISWGVEEVLYAADTEMEYDGWTEFVDPGTGLLTFEPFSMKRDTRGNRIIHSSAYLLWAFGTEQTALRGELGIRGEHFYLWNGETDYDINTYPVVTPRFNISWVPVRDQGIMDRLTLSFGTGLFCQFPLDSTSAEEKYGIDDFEFGPNQVFFGVLGAEVLLEEGWKFQLEGYGKYAFNRLYVTNSDPNGADDSWVVKNDGIGYTLGFDVMIQKKFGRKFDGYLTYSFIYSRYLNPTDPEYDGQNTLVPTSEPLGEWYYPAFHRFHNLNLILNYRPVEGMTLTLKGSLATGAPKADVGSIYSYPVTMGATTIERYGRTTAYSDSLRNEISFPIDLRVSYASYFKGTKIRWEFYCGVEDILVNLYSAKGNKSFDAYTGEYLENGDQADFSIGIPIPSFGFKISY